MVDFCQEDHSQRSAPQKRHMAHLRRSAPCNPENREAGPGEAIRCSLQLRAIVLAKHLVIWSARTWEGQKTQAQPSLRLCGVPENLNLSSLDLGSACNPGPASDISQQSNLDPEQCRLAKHICREQGQIQCGRDTASTPYTWQ